MHVGAVCLFGRPERLVLPLQGGSSCLIRKPNGAAAKAIKVSSRAVSRETRAASSKAVAVSKVVRAARRRQAKKEATAAPSNTLRRFVLQRAAAHTRVCASRASHSRCRGGHIGGGRQIRTPRSRGRDSLGVNPAGCVAEGRRVFEATSQAVTGRFGVRGAGGITARGITTRGGGA